MRCVGGLVGLVLCAALAAPLGAQEQAQPQAAQACSNPDPLGVSRTLTVDTKGGPWLGEPHGDKDLLAPGEVVLTFDDGPMPRSTRGVLAALAAQCTKATFFMVGQMAAAYPGLVQEVAAQGHTIGTHTWSHANVRTLSQPMMRAQIEAAFSAVSKAANAPIAPFFRYPYLVSSNASVAYLKSRDIAQIAVDVDSLDWLHRNASAVVSRVMAGLKARGKGIILMHDIHMSTALALPLLLTRLKQKGYKVVHLVPKVPLEAIVVADASLLKRHARASGLDARSRRLPQAKQQAGPQDLFSMVFK
jgi:peptidoglycan/xylan/chitin deacetylase (PgdA/CDA1 family)